MPWAVPRAPCRNHTPGDPSECLVSESLATLREPRGRRGSNFKVGLKKCYACKSARFPHCGSYPSQQRLFRASVVHCRNYDYRIHRFYKPFNRMVSQPWRTIFPAFLSDLEWGSAPIHPQEKGDVGPKPFKTSVLKPNHTGTSPRI